MRKLFDITLLLDNSIDSSNFICNLDESFALVHNSIDMDNNANDKDLTTPNVTYQPLCIQYLILMLTLNINLV